MRETVIVVGFSLLALAHALTVGVRYHVGSFDDDASYILTARALAHGGGFATILGPGQALISTYPPGFAVFLVPLVWIGGHSLNIYRLFPLLCYLAVFPLTWLFLGRRRVSLPVRSAVLGLLAVNTVFGTYATMVMAETLFVVLLLILVMVAEAWDRQAQLWSWSAAATVAIGSLLVWVKEAGVGIVAGIVLLFLLRRSWSKAALTAVGSFLLFTPVLIARVVVGTPTVGSRYLNDINGHAGLWHRVWTMPHSLWLYLATALPKSIIPTMVSPFPRHGGLAIALDVIRWTVAPLTIAGVVVWWRRIGWKVPAVVGAYVVETLAYPYINERRVVLILPIVLAWYALGAAAAARLAGHAVARRPRMRSGPMGSTLVTRLTATFGVLAVMGPFIFLFPKDYLLPLWQSTAQPENAPYMAMLAQLGSRSSIVETDYLWTTSLMTGHRTARGAYRITCPSLETTDPTPPPSPTPIADALRGGLDSDQASFLLVAGLEAPKSLSNPCLVRLLASEPSTAVRLLRIPVDDASVFELVGPGTGQPTLRDYAAGAILQASSDEVTWRQEGPQVRGAEPVWFPVVPAAGGQGSIGWSWATPEPISQLSVGAAESEGSATRRVTLQLRTAGGVWTTVASSGGPVGGHASVPYLLAKVDPPIVATAARAVIEGDGKVGIHDLHAIGPVPAEG